MKTAYPDIHVVLVEGQDGQFRLYDGVAHTDGMVRQFELERGWAVEGKAMGSDEREAPRGFLPRTLAEIDEDITLWKSRLAGPEPKAAPVVPEGETATCRHCSRKLRPTFKLVSTRVETPDGGCYVVDEPGELLGFGYTARGHFCSLRCGWRFAVDSIEGTSS
jgi:hypothetical protein